MPTYRLWTNNEIERALCLKKEDRKTPKHRFNKEEKQCGKF